MKGKKFIILLVLFIALVLTNDTFAQCAMCKASLENNVSNGDIGMAARLNVGILYLFFLPYVLVAVLAVLWYKKSKKNKQQAIISQQRKKRLSQLGL